MATVAAIGLVAWAFGIFGLGFLAGRASMRPVMRDARDGLRQAVALNSILAVRLHARHPRDPRTGRFCRKDAR